MKMIMRVIILLLLITKCIYSFTFTPCGSEIYGNLFEEDKNSPKNMITPKDALIAYRIYLGELSCSDYDCGCADMNIDNEITPGDALSIFAAYMDFKQTYIYLTLPGQSDNVYPTPIAPELRIYKHGLTANKKGES